MIHEGKQSLKGNSANHEFFIQWHLTERCNLRCTHCYQEGTTGDEMSIREIREVIEETADTLRVWTDNYDIHFSPSFSITGGEPFIRRDIFEILEEIRNKDIDIYILSNGTLIDKKLSGRLSDMGIKGVQVSIEGPEGIHDRIRGKGSFVMSLRGIGNLIDSGMQVTLNVTLSNLNAGYADELVSLASNLGAQRLGFSRLVPSGRGRQLLKEMIEADQLKKIYESLLSREVEGLDIVTGDPVASQINMKIDNDTGCTAYGGCAAGISGLTIRPDGTINPCRRLSIPIGNIRKDSLREVWANSEVLNLLRDKNRYKGKCGICERWAGCRGCRAIAYAYSVAKRENDYLAEDPQCFMKECIG